MAEAITVKVNGITLPSELVSLRRGDEILWSEGTGRSADNGLMVGSVVATKCTYTLEWGVITQDQYAQIISAIGAGFFNFQVITNGGTIANISAYRSNISGDYLGKFGGVAYWRGVTVEIIER